MPANLETPKLELPPDRPPIFVSAGIIKNRTQILAFSEVPELAGQVIGDFSDKQNYPRGTGRRFYYDEASGSAYNAFRLRNPGRKAVSKHLSESIKVVQGAGQLAIVGITPLKHEDPLVVVPDMTEWAKEMGADAIEINTSCPNENSDDLLCHDMAKTKRVVTATRERVGDDPYLILKVSPLGEMTIRCYKDDLDVDAISPINSIRQLSPSNPETRLPFIEVNDGYAGQSGPAISRLARHNLQSWLRNSNSATEFPVKNPQFDVWSVGGVDTGYEVYDRVHNVGAFMVGGAQAFYRADNPAQVAEQWAREYTEALEQATD